MRNSQKYANLRHFSRCRKHPDPRGYDQSGTTLVKNSLEISGGYVQFTAFVISVICFD